MRDWVFVLNAITSSAWLRSAQRSSVPKFDSDLFCSEKFISWDWLREAQLLNSTITQTCFTQKRFDQNFDSILILKVQRTSMSFKSYFGALEDAGGSWMGFGIYFLIWIWSLVFGTPMIQILALSLDFEGEKTSMSFKSWFGALDDDVGSWSGFCSLVFNWMKFYDSGWHSLNFSASSKSPILRKNMNPGLVGFGQFGLVRSGLVRFGFCFNVWLQLSQPNILKRGVTEIYICSWYLPNQ